MLNKTILIEFFIIDRTQLTQLFYFTVQNLEVVNLFIYYFLKTLCFCGNCDTFLRILCSTEQSIYCDLECP